MAVDADNGDSCLTELELPGRPRAERPGLLVLVLSQYACEREVLGLVAHGRPSGATARELVLT
ncbi:hypothetical protein OH768_21580 [Streptomyces sp. NBC_01622]|uniref:hypothetical protein n=1 Tax=Streptomyces sp. NBC_01622 TaxID=2975903 RepID=UPI00386F1C9E|nr:hypothetical protein OH768_21580 [Streptomyces sp. NBC_01622]